MKNLQRGTSDKDGFFFFSLFAHLTRGNLQCCSIRSINFFLLFCDLEVNLASWFLLSSTNECVFGATCLLSILHFIKSILSSRAGFVWIQHYQGTV